MDDDVGFFQHAHGFERDQLGIARVPRPHRRACRRRSWSSLCQRVDGGRSHRAAAHASSHGEEGHAARVGCERVLGLRRADEAHRDAEDRRRLRARRRRASRAIETARSARCRSPPPHRQGDPATAPAQPPSGWCRVFPRARRHARSCSVQTTSLRAGSRARVTPCATISESHRMGAPRANASRAASTRPAPNAIWPATSTHPQAWIMRTTMSASPVEKRERSASARMMANERS